ncbi:MAG TPA: RagB/SusD family nutrient uptake outer membrane protein [Ferruginibacter sp.]|nr:RagB/SusD family nutrient uptake outer membrane protein [Ferruginibacter sp.]HRE64260.1 RagB/SusD family nutrient uptake outer membrane protein [Ferruginibacter sp.]
MKKILIGFSTIAVLSITACKKDYLETEPSGAVPMATVLGQINTIYSAMQGIEQAQFAFGANGVTRHDNYGQKAWDLSMDLMGNDMVVHSQGYGWFNSSYNYTEFQTAVDGRQSANAWYFYYDIIKQANAVLAVVDNASGATQAQKETVKGQALGLRAYAYYYLVNLFQQSYKGNETKPGIPLYTALTTDGKPRGTVQEVYDQILADLTAAEPLLNGKPRVSKTNVDVSVIRGLRARVALMMEDWATAANYANLARQGYTIMTNPQLVSTSAYSSLGASELMWGSLIPAELATIYASFYSHMDIRTGGYAALGGQKKITKELFDKISATDIRKTMYRTPGTGTTTNPDYNQLKHQVPTAGSWAADYSYMRISEMFMIQAEALARQGQDGPARTALEAVVVARDPSYSAAAFSGAALVNEIVLQRRIELWGEGFGLFDVKRLGQGLNRPSGAGNHGAPNFNPSVYTTSANDPRFLMRIPQAELNNNSSLTPADQNP